MVDILECPICKSRELKKFIRCKDYTVSHETFEILQCASCQLAITSPRPDTQNLGKYYQSDDYVSHSGKSSGGIGFVYKMVRSFTLSWKKRIINKHKNEGDLLDFGCGTGEFLDRLLQSGWKVTGVEPSDTARLKSEILTKQQIHTSLEEISNKSFDVITAWHVIEHVPNFQETVLKIRKLLKKDGIIFIAVPNYQSPDARKYKEHWAGFDVPRHLWHFSKQSMQAILKETGLQLIEMVPMKLDAYYVSLLSEKYKKNNRLSIPTLLNGFVSGLKSNLTARKSVNHSSLIYIAKNT